LQELSFDKLHWSYATENQTEPFWKALAALQYLKTVKIEFSMYIADAENSEALFSSITRLAHIR